MGCDLAGALGVQVQCMLRASRGLEVDKAKGAQMLKLSSLQWSEKDSGKQVGQTGEDEAQSV